MTERRKKRERVPDVLVLDADTVIDEWLGRDPAADGLVEALAVACFRFGFNGDLKREYRHQPWMKKMGVKSVALEQLLGVLYSKGRRARGPQPTVPSRLGWDPKDDHLIHAAVGTGAGRIVTRENKLLRAGAAVRKKFGLEVIDNAAARMLSQRTCPEYAD